MGVLGGCESSAYYIFGFNEKGKYYYLDPHYTQDTKNLDTIDIESYFSNKTISEMVYGKLNCSVQFGFVFRGNQDFDRFWSYMDCMVRTMEADDLFLSISEYKMPDFNIDEIIVEDSF